MMVNSRRLIIYLKRFIKYFLLIDVMTF